MSSSEESESESEWEEVEVPEHAILASLPKPEDEAKTDKSEGGSSPSVPEGGLVITVPGVGGLLQRGRKKFDPNEMLRLHLNRKIRKVQMLVHKTDLLCCLSRLLLLNKLLNQEELRGLALSLIQGEVGAFAGNLGRSVNWLRTRFFAKGSEKGIVYPYKMQYGVRDEAVDPDEGLTHLEAVLNLYFSREGRAGIPKFHKTLIAVIFLRVMGFDVRLVWSLQPSRLKPDNDVLLKKPVQEQEENGDEEVEATKSNAKEKKNPKKAKKMSSGDDDVDYEEEDDDDEDFVEKKNKKTTKRKTKLDEPAKKKTSKGKGNMSVAKTKSPKSPATKKSKIISSDEEQEAVFQGPNSNDNFWIEVYDSSERRWICVEVDTGKVDNPDCLEAKATSPILYVLAVENDDSIKDVTKRYVRKWLTIVSKRVDADWWEVSLESFATRFKARDNKENKLLDNLVLTKSIPESVQDLKNHPLYITHRHLKKFEVIYPENAQPVGTIKGVPFYSLNNLKTLRSREKWLREAKVVRIGEKPYKTVKSRQKFNKISNRFEPNEKPLEVFGEWQVEDYVPPVAKDGKVPRNEYGNVELFKPSMLPKGTVHLVLPGLNRVARKLDIDCAPALIGFEFTSSGSHPVTEGFVVCKEFEEVLLDAWNQEQDAQEKKAIEKRRTRALANWRKLIRGVMIKLRLTKRYPLDGSSSKSQFGNTSNKKSSIGLRAKPKPPSKSILQKRQSNSEKTVENTPRTKRKRMQPVKEVQMSEEDTDEDFEVPKKKASQQSIKTKEPPSAPVRRSARNRK